MSELKPCPFCGGEAKTVTDYYFRNTRCSSCGATGWQCCTESEAIEAWNTRYEPTTRIVQGTKGVPLGESLVYSLTCEACGCGVSAKDSYCRSCGARIVKEDTDAD